MTLLVLFRTRLEWCNYTCSYCPWNATVSRVEAQTFREDAGRVKRIVNRVAELKQAVEFFITPKAEYLVLPYWREAIRCLLGLPQVRRVTVQTNLSFDLGAFLDSIPVEKLALWTTYHPCQLDESGLVELQAKWQLLLERGVPFSVGMVALRENLPLAERIRQRLDGRVYLWLNAYKREKDYYSPEDQDRCRKIDPWFDLNDQHYHSRGKPCTAGQRAVYLDDEGDLRRCFFVGEVLGNLFGEGWQTLDEATACPEQTCSCYVGQMHPVELDFRSIYGSYLAARIPKPYHELISPMPRQSSRRWQLEMAP